MKTIRVMDRTGDTVVEFDETNAQADATKEAKALFERLSKTGAVFDMANGKVTNFNDLGPENVFVPRIVGG